MRGKSNFTILILCVSKLRVNKIRKLMEILPKKSSYFVPCSHTAKEQMVKIAIITCRHISGKTTKRTIICKTVRNLAKENWRGKKN